MHLIWLIILMFGFVFVDYTFAFYFNLFFIGFCDLDITF